MMNEKTLIVHHFHKQNDNTDFFARNAFSDSPNIDYIFTINDPTFENENYLKLEAEYPNKLKIMRRRNSACDYGGYGYALFNSDWKKYDYFIFINSSCRGPFLPSYWPQNKHWSEAFTDKINNEVKLVGPEIYLNYRAGEGCDYGGAFLGGYCFATDKVGVEIGIKKGIFKPNLKMSRSQVVYKCEVGFSTYIMRAGYNIAALTTHSQGIDFRKGCEACKKIWERRIHLYLDKRCKSRAASTWKLLNEKGKERSNPCPLDWEPALAHSQCLEQYAHPYELIFSKAPPHINKGDKERAKLKQPKIGEIGMLDTRGTFSDWHDKRCK
ncbi:hypothetical protein CMI37_38065 [Candidatus Pacearchaeota archaeon]|nr:hypothetical protein [Candidatus Pacearchaeota archaeon]|tara:strand:- start:743 stop:1717 length:975 start_codon:yes stop_codon:yes gene_type:complete